MNKPIVHVIDDELSVRRALSRLLRSHNHQVCTYSSPQEFLSKQLVSCPAGIVLVGFATTTGGTAWGFVHRFHQRPRRSFCFRPRHEGGSRDKPKLFTPFFTTKNTGLGMGLSICRSIIRSLGGHIRFENRTGGGAAFQVPLPLAAQRHFSTSA